MPIVVDSRTHAVLGQLLREEIGRDGGDVTFVYLTKNGVERTSSLTAHVETYE